MVEIKAAIISLGSKSSEWTFTAMQKYFDKVDKLDREGQQIAKVKKTFRQGNLTFLFYIVDFIMIWRFIFNRHTAQQ